MDIAASEGKASPGLLSEFFQTTLTALVEAKNDRLWFKAKMKLGKEKRERKKKKKECCKKHDC